MYLKTLRLKNFKCFSDVKLDFGKITLLLGANSTGKSTLLHGILAALQSDQFPIVLSANGDLVNLGDFRSMSHGHRTDYHISISLSFTQHMIGAITLGGTFSRSGRTGMPELLSATMTNPSLKLEVSRPDRYRADWTYNIKKDAAENRPTTESSKQFYAGLGSVLRDFSKSPDFPEDPFGPPPPSGKLAFSRPVDFFNRLYEAQFLTLHSKLHSLITALGDFKNTFNYIGSFRIEPLRSYYEIARGDLKVQHNGNNYIEQISEWQERKAPQLKKLKTAARRLKLFRNVRTNRLRGGLFEIKVRQHDAAPSMSLADVGFGISQILPVMVADLQQPQGSTLAVSQPEIHLHPSVQADLADYLVHGTKAFKNRYIIETHSEYLINRIRVLVAKGQLQPKDISVVYLTNDGNKSVLHPLHFTKSGRIDGAPKEFFETYMLDVMNIALNAAAN